MRVALAEDGAALELLVEDDGAGFPPERLRQRLAAGHVGLASQRVRIEAVGGTLDVASAPGDGTRVLVALPLRSAAPKCPRDQACEQRRAGRREDEGHREVREVGGVEVMSGLVQEDEQAEQRQLGERSERKSRPRSRWNCGGRWSAIRRTGGLVVDAPAVIEQPRTSGRSCDRPMLDLGRARDPEPVSQGLHIGRIAGIPVDVNWTWVIVFALIDWTLAASVFPSTTSA